MSQTLNRSDLCLYKPRPCLTFAPLAWLKLQYFCHAGPTEVGGFGISDADDLLYVEDFVTVRQQVSPAYVRFENEAVADYFDACIDRGIPVSRFARLWMHTHPGESVTPSATDEDTFADSFGRCDWAVMFILARTGRTYARLSFRAGPGGQIELPTAVDWSDWPNSLLGQSGKLEAQVEKWQQEYTAHVQPMPETNRLISLMDEFDGLEERWWESFPHTPDLDEVFFRTVPNKESHEPANDRPASGPRSAPA